MVGGPCLRFRFLFDIMYKYKVGEAVTEKDLINNVNWEYLERVDREERNTQQENMKIVR